MNRTKLLWIAITLSLAQLNSFSQAIKGIVTDEKAKGVPFATISLYRLPDSSMVKEQVTDSAGKFTLLQEQTGKFLLRISAIGLQTLDRSIDLADQDLYLGQLMMRTDPALMDAVIVNGAHPVFQRQADKLVVKVSGNQFFRTASNGLDVLRKIPGLELNYDGSLQLSGRVTPSIFIDGKPLPMSAGELQQFLQTLTPEMIASIDLISNPSAQYDGEHKAIIDIKLKKDQGLGWKGTVSTNVQLNNYAISDNSLLLTYKAAATAFTLRGGYTGGSKIYRYEAWQQLANTNWMRTKNGVSTLHNNFNIQIGAEHALSKKHRLEWLLRTTHNLRTPDAFGTLQTTDASTKNLVSLIGTDNQSSPSQRSYAASFNYSGGFGKTQLQWLNNILEIRTRQKEDIISNDLISPSQLLYWKTSLVNDISIRSTQADLSSSWGKNKLGAGAKFAYSNTYNDSRYDTLTRDHGFVPDESRNFLFRYQEYIGAAYISWSTTRNRFTYSASVRIENTRSIADAPKIRETTKRDLWHWLPSAGIQFNIDENDQLQLNFSRKLTRPVFSDLYPFRIYNSPLNYFTGNPYLTPALTTSFNLSWTHHHFNASFFIGRENDPLGRYPKYDPTTNVLEYLGKNFDHRNFVNLEMSWPLEITKWWRMTNTVGGYFVKEHIPYFEYNFAVPVKYLTLNGSQVFTLPGRLTLDLSYYYKSKNGNSLYTSRPNSNIDIGLQKNWWKGKLNSKLSVHDIFNSYKIVYIFREKQIINNTLSHWPGMRRLALTLSYNFGRSTYKAKQQTRSEEEGRAM